MRRFSSTHSDLTVSPTQLKRTLQELEQRFENVRQVSDPNTLSKQIADLEENASKPNFWEDRSSAEALLSDLKNLKDDLRKISDMKNGIEEVSMGYELLTETEMEDQELLSFQACSSMHCKTSSDRFRKR